MRRTLVSALVIATLTLAGCSSGNTGSGSSANDTVATNNAQINAAPCPEGINPGASGIFAAEAEKYPELRNGPTAARFDCTVLPWPTTVDQSLRSAKKDEIYAENAVAYGLENAVPDRDIFKDALAVCELWRSNGQYQPVVNTIESQGYRRIPGDEQQSMATNVLGSAILTYCPKYGQAVVNQANAIMEDSLRDTGAIPR